jgi:trk system potassium uptake protein TrkA
MPKAGEPKRVAVIGLGRFGESMALTLAELGYEVTAVDIDERRVAEIADRVTLAAQGDGTDEEMLCSLAVDQSDVGIVGQGKNLEASVLITLVLKRLGVPWVVAKAESALHGELLARIGADRIVFPERDAGVRAAHALTVRNIDDYITLSPTTGLAKVDAPPGSAGATLGELCARLGTLTPLLIKRGDALLLAPAWEERVQPGDELVVVGSDAAIGAFADAEPLRP